MSIDVETTGLDIRAAHGRIGLWILNTPKKAFLFREPPSWLDAVVADGDIQKLIFNAPFDLGWMIRELDIQVVRNVRDLYLEELLVSDGKRNVSHRLETTLDRRLGVTIGKGINHDEVDWTGPLSDEMLDYALDDGQYMHPLADELQRLIDRSGQTRAAQIDNAAVFATACIAYNGIAINVRGWIAALREWKKQAAVLKGELQNTFPTVRNFNSTQQLQVAIQEQLGISVSSTAKDVLATLAPEYPEIDLLLRYRKPRDRVQRWGLGFLREHLHPDTRRIHASWWQLGARTGRYSCSKPNEQQFLRGPELRSNIVPESGKILYSLDYKAIEVLVAAILAQDPALLDACVSGDPHTRTAALITDKPESEIDYDTRQMAKAANFELIFGGGVDSFRAYAQSSFGVVLSETDAAQMVARYRRAFPQLERQRLVANGIFRREPDMVEVRNMIGMRRVLVGHDLKPTTYLNTRIQSTAAYGQKAGLGRVVEHGLARSLTMVIHDEIVGELEKDGAEEKVALLHACMRQGMRDVIGPYPVQVDVYTGETWT